MWPVYEFRPLPGFFCDEFRRYADGKWIADDGEYDLAFIGQAKSEGGGAYSCTLFFEPPYQRNIIYSWLTTHWRANVQEHPGGNPWHHALREGETEWGGDWGMYNHPNRRAGDAGSRKLCGERGCSNGQHVELKSNDPHIIAGLLRERDNKKIFTWPRNMRCMYCDMAAPVKFAAEAA